MSVPMNVPSTEVISGVALIYSVISGLIGIILFLIWRAALELRADIKDLFILHRTCRDDLKKEFVQISDFSHLKDKVEEISEDRKEKWKAYFAHKHSQTGKVEIE